SPETGATDDFERSRALSACWSRTGRRAALVSPSRPHARTIGQRLLPCERARTISCSVFRTPHSANAENNPRKGARGAPGPRGSRLPSPFADAISTLNDRALRRLLGARAFLRGYDYVRRRAVDNVELGDASAKGQVRGTDPEPYAVQLQLTPSGFASECTCPAFSKINGHCKHVAALLIAL